MGDNEKRRILWFLLEADADDGLDHAVELQPLARGDNAILRAYDRGGTRLAGRWIRCKPQIVRDLAAEGAIALDPQTDRVWILPRGRGIVASPGPGDARPARARYMAQLDSLRVFALGAVFLQRFVSVEHLPWGLRSFAIGFSGVRFFFVLSGFLITGILLHCRDLADGGAQSRGLLMRRFYIRRLLRLCPVYFLVLAVALTFNLPPSRDVWPWLVTFTTNLHLVAGRHEWIGMLSHLWTLGVEQQFYLVWPWAVLFVPRRWLLPLVGLTIALGPAWRWYATAHELGDIAIYSFTAGCLDTLGMGALLAIVAARYPREAVRRQLTRFALPGGVATIVLLQALLVSGVDWKAYVVFFDLGLALVFVWLIHLASGGFGGMVGWLLEARPLVYCGQITYGIYIYHMFTPLLTMPAIEWLGLGRWAWQPGPWLALAVITSLLLASASWYVLERPINDLKRFFPYRPHTPDRNAHRRRVPEPTPVATTPHG